MGLFVGLFLIPTPYPQYLLYDVPLLAIFAAVFLIWLVRDSASESMLAAAVTVAITGFMILVGLAIAKPVIIHPVVYPFLWIIATVAALVLVRRGKEEWAVSVLVAALCVLPLQWFRWQRDLDNSEQLALIKHVQQVTSPSDTVLDGWTGAGLFRDPAWKYWKLHSGIRSLLTRDEIRKLESSLLDGTLQPAIVLRDEQLQQLSPVINDFLDNNYNRSGPEPAWIIEYHH